MKARANVIFTRMAAAASSNQLISCMFVAVLVSATLPYSTTNAAETGAACPNFQQSEWTNCNGVASYPDGSRYVGAFQDGRRQGKGVLTFSDGGVYAGDFQEDVFEGDGVLRLADGMKYVGQFHQGRINGRGVMSLAEGGELIGEFRDGVLATAVVADTDTSARVEPGARPSDAEAHPTGIKVDIVTSALFLVFAGFLSDLLLVPVKTEGPKKTVALLMSIAFVAGMLAGPKMLAVLDAIIQSSAPANDPAAPEPPNAGQAKMGM